MRRLFIVFAAVFCFVPIVNAHDSELRAGKSVSGTLSSEDYFTSTGGPVSFERDKNGRVCLLFRESVREWTKTILSGQLYRD